VRERLAGGSGSSAREIGGAERLHAHEKQAGNGPKGGETWARGGRAAAHGLDSAQQKGGRVFLFFFLFSNSYFHFCIFFF
jgi:hypothetical protein